MNRESYYSDQEIDYLLMELSTLFEKNEVSTELSLMVLGNMVTYIINTNTTPMHRQAVVSSFFEALKKSINLDQVH